MVFQRKEWLVRTQGREILGPFSEQELMELFENQQFSATDEICQSGKHWMSAQNLTHRVKSDFTSSFYQTTTQSMATEPAIAIVEETTPTPSADAPVKADPTPENKAKLRLIRPGTPTPTTHKKPSHPSMFWVLTFTFVVGALFLSTFFFKSSKTVPVQTAQISTEVSEGEGELTKELYQMIRRGETKKALEKAQSYHESAQKKSELEYLIPYSALLIVEEESFPRAKRLLDKILEAPTSLKLKAKAHHWLGYILLSRSEGDMGENHFLEALQMNPKDPAARFNLGRAYLKQQKYSQALDYFQLAELEQPKLWLIHIYKGRAKAALGYPFEAMESFRKATEVSPDRWLTHIYYALFLQQNQREKDAKQVILQMFTRDPQYEIQSPPPMGYYQEKTSYAEYIEVVSKILENARNDEKLFAKTYLEYLHSSHIDKNKFDSLQTLYGNRGKMLALKVALDKENTDPKVLEALVQTLPENIRELGYFAYVLRGEANLRLGQMLKAGTDFQMALSMAPQAALSQWVYAVLLRRMNKKADSDQVIQSILSIHPNYIPAIIAAE